MMIKRYKKCSWWPYLLSFLIVAILATLLFGGLRSFIDYKKSVDRSLEFDLSLFRFFIKENIKRRYMNLTTNRSAAEAKITTFNLYADEMDLASMDSNLPSSGKARFMQGHIRDNAGWLNSEMKFRYRGGLPLHWLYQKKSFRVRLPPFTTYRGERQFNLVNPSTIHTVTDWVSYDMSRSLGLLTPDYFPVRVNVNNETNGLHFFLSRIDESFLRKNRRMPGSIYSGDTYYMPEFSNGKEVETGEVFFMDDEGISLMWVDDRLWEKDAARNSETKSDRSDIQKFVEIINEPSKLRFMEMFEAYFDKEKFFMFWGLDTLTGTYHHDMMHNHKIYFDPYKGKFEPIEWDLRFWSNSFKVKDLVTTPLLLQVKLNPILEYERDLVGYRVFTKFSYANVAQKIADSNSAIEAEVAADPVRHTPDHRYMQFNQSKSTPYTLSEYDAAISELKQIYKSRYAFVESVYNNVVAGFYFEASADNRVLLNIAVVGNTPLQFEPWTIIPNDLKENVTVDRIFNGEESSVQMKSKDILYPGRRIVEGNALGRTDFWSLSVIGNKHLQPSPLRYQYLIEGLKLSDFKETSMIKVKNAITKQDLLVAKNNSLPSAEKTDSIHPWAIRFSLLPTEEIHLSGVVTVKEDRVYNSNQLVTILPGTVFKLSKGSSLIFHGKVIAKGTKQSPIIFKQLINNEPWGSVVIQGSAASGSILQYVEFEGGSVLSYKLINYPGQLNIHDVKSFELNNCLVRNNHIGDDAVHIAYSQGVISDCKFENTAFDALDMDIADVSVLSSKFTNIGNDAMDLMSANVLVDNVSVYKAGDKCISAGEQSTVTVKNAVLHKCVFGIAVKDESRAELEDVEFDQIQEFGISLYQKNPRYGAGGTVTGLRLSGISATDIQLDKASKNLIPADAYISKQSKLLNQNAEPENTKQ